MGDREFSSRSRDIAEWTRRWGLFLILWIVLASGSGRSQSFEVLSVTDGDTILVECRGEKLRVRLIGVDTPETVHPRSEVQHYGREASRFLENLLSGEKVELRYESGRPSRDKYGRLLAYVYRLPDRLFVNAEIIRQGYGHAYTEFPFRHMAEFRSLEQQARKAGKGLWASSDTEATTPEPELAKPAPVPDRSGGVIVYVTPSGSKYHRAGCPHLRRGKRMALPLAAARRSYAPCSVCRPPG